MRETDELPLPTTRPLLSPRRTDVARCPFCHADVTRHSGRVLACEQCRAYHHPACWHEGEGCSGCGARAVFASERDRTLVETTGKSPETDANAALCQRPRRGVVLGVALAGLLLLMIVAVWLLRPVAIVDSYDRIPFCPIVPAPPHDLPIDLPRAHAPPRIHPERDTMPPRSPRPRSR